MKSLHKTNTMKRLVKIQTLGGDISKALDENYKLHYSNLLDNNLYHKIKDDIRRDSDWFGDALEELMINNLTIDYEDAVNLNQWDILCSDFFIEKDQDAGIYSDIIELLEVSMPAFIVAYKIYSSDQLEIGLNFYCDEFEALDNHNLMK